MKTHPYKKLFPAAKNNANAINWDTTGGPNKFPPRQVELLSTQKRLKVVCWSDIHCAVCDHN